VGRIADSGYSTLLMPDFPLLQPAPGPTLATAAATNTDHGSTRNSSVQPRSYTRSCERHELGR
jgi:hypothetical protein